jgi:hypothetical protein
MKIWLVKLFLLIVMLISGGLMAERKDYTDKEHELKEHCVHELVDIFATEMEEKFGLYCSGVGGSMPWDIRKIGVRFCLQKETSIEEARELQVRATERFIEIINGSQKIRPYLIEYPWTHNGVEIAISFLKPDGFCYKNAVSLIFQAKGKLFYYGERGEDSLESEIKEETYEEAKQIVETSPSCLKSIEKKKKGWLSWIGL